MPKGKQMIKSIMSAIDIFTGGLNGLMFAGSNKMAITVRQNKRITSFEVESGESRSDHVVFEPVEISIDFIVSELMSKGAMKGFENAYRNNELMTISTALGVYDNMMIVSMPRYESGEILLGAFLTIQFKEYREVTPAYGEMTQESVANPSNADSVDRGTVKGKPDDNRDPPAVNISVGAQIQDYGTKKLTEWGWLE